MEASLLGELWVIHSDPRGIRLVFRHSDSSLGFGLEGQICFVLKGSVFVIRLGAVTEHFALVSVRASPRWS